MSDVQFQNAYVEVLLDNFVSVVKQNVYLQAQQKVYEQSVEKANEINIQASKLAEKNILLQTEIQQLNQELSKNGDIRQKADAGENYKKEKDRLQASLNDFMRKNKALLDEITELKLTHNSNLITLSENSSKQNAQIDRLNNYIVQLEQNVPASKLKKIKISDNKVEEVEIKNGGTF